MEETCFIEKQKPTPTIDDDDESIQLTPVPVRRDGDKDLKMRMEEQKFDLQMDERKLSKNKCSSQYIVQNCRRLRPIHEAEEDVTGIRLETQVIESEIARKTEEQKVDLNQKNLQWQKEGNRLMKKIDSLQERLINTTDSFFENDTPTTSAFDKRRAKEKVELEIRKTETGERNVFCVTDTIQESQSGEEEEEIVVD